MSRSTRVALALIASVALAAVAVIVPAAAANAAGWTWQTTLGAIPSDLFPDHDFRLDSSYDSSPGYDINARSNGLAHYCDLINSQPNHVTPYGCNPGDYDNVFRIDSSSITDGIATVVITPTDPTSPQLILDGPQSQGNYVQIFTSTDHAYLFRAGLLSGKPQGQTGTTSTQVCYFSVPCTVLYDTSVLGADTFLQLNARKTYVFDGTGVGVFNGAQYFIPVTPRVAAATPPTAAFVATVSGTAAHDWAFDGSGSTAVSPNTVLSYQWTFGDGSTETTTTSTTHHTYSDGSAHAASLVVVDSAGTASTSVSHTLTEPVLIVNSTGDAPATDPAKGCDTGGTVGTPPAPECTLRAAIQSLDAGVGGLKISFALAAGSTTITAASPLPDITKAGATIDGTESSGMPTISGSSLHVKNAAGVTITKVSIVASGDYGVLFDGSPGATVTSSSIGVSTAGVISAPKFGVAVSSSGSVTVGGSGAGNVIEGSVNGLLLIPDGPIAALTVRGNSIGELSDGTLVPGTGSIGLALFAGPDTPVTGAVIADNQVAGFRTNVSIAGSGVNAPQITGNRIGVAADQSTLLGAASANLRLDGIPGAVVSDNQIAGAISYDLLVCGSVQVSSQPSPDDPNLAQILYRQPGGVGSEAPLANPIVGIHDTISGNRIGTLTRQPSGGDAAGVEVWNAADDTTISGNTVLNHGYREISVTGSGARLRVAGNTAGASSADSVSLYTGLQISGVPAPTVSQNSVGGVFMGIDLTSDVTGAVVSGNTVGFGPDGASALPIGGVGISISGPNATVGPDNTVGNSAGQGIYIGGAHSQVFSNRVGAAKFGSSAAANLEGISVSAKATGAVIGGPGKGNTIVGNGTGLKLQGAGADVGGNTFGIITSGALGNGIGIDAGAAASIRDNTIANSTTQAVTVDRANVVTLLHNSIYGTTGGLSVSGAGDPPTVLAAARVMHGSSARTFLVLQNVPTGAGTIEVFGNSGCADPEGRVPLFTTPTTQDGVRVISVADRTELAGLTVMVTTSAGTTRFSNCEGSTVQPDDDGDGIPDIVEEAYPVATGLQHTARSAAFVADNQQWVALSANGTLSNVSPIDDPDPSGHPGATFPLGLIDWTVSGIDPGSFADVAFTLPGSVINGWWKYSPHHSPAYFDYEYSSIAGYGAKVVAANLPKFGLSTNVVVRVPDGGVGDDDGLENGSVHDPSAPAVVPSDAPPIIPIHAAEPTAVGPTVSSAKLASTGTDPLGGVETAVLALLVGLLLLGARFLTRRRGAPAR